MLARSPASKAVSEYDFATFVGLEPAVVLSNVRKPVNTALAESVSSSPEAAALQKPAKLTTARNVWRSPASMQKAQAGAVRGVVWYDSDSEEDGEPSSEEEDDTEMLCAGVERLLWGN